MTFFESSTIPLNVTPNLAQNAVSSGTPNGAVWDNGFVRTVHLCVITSTGTISTGAITFEGSLDNVTWYPIVAAVTITQQTTQLAQTTNPMCARFLRARVSTAITGGGTVTANVSSGA